MGTAGSGRPVARPGHSGRPIADCGLGIADCQDRRDPRDVKTRADLCFPSLKSAIRNAQSAIHHGSSSTVLMRGLDPGLILLSAVKRIFHGILSVVSIKTISRSEMLLI